MLKPSGQAVIEDIRHLPEYAAVFRASSCGEVRRVGSLAASVLWTLITFGSLRPGTLVVRKSA